MDGYKDNIIEKLLFMQELFTKQVELNHEISLINKEMNSLPEIPDNMEQWIDSVSNIDAPGFRLEDFKKMFKISKKYNSLIESRDHNSTKIKILVIDNLLDRIKDILDK